MAGDVWHEPDLRTSWSSPFVSLNLHCSCAHAWRNARWRLTFFEFRTFSKKVVFFYSNWQIGCRFEFRAISKEVVYFSFILAGWMLRISYFLNQNWLFCLSCFCPQKSKWNSFEKNDGLNENFFKFWNFWVCLVPDYLPRRSEMSSLWRLTSKNGKNGSVSLGLMFSYFYR